MRLYFHLKKKNEQGAGATVGDDGVCLWLLVNFSTQRKRVRDEKDVMKYS